MNPPFDPLAEAVVRLPQAPIGMAATRDTLAELSFEHAAIPCFWIDRDGRFVRANQIARRIYGYSEDEFRRLRVHDVNLLIASATWPQYWEQLRAAGSLVHAGMHLARDGNVFPARVHLRHVEVDGAEYAIKCILDLTELQSAQQAGREFEWQYQQIAQSCEDVFWVVEAETHAVRCLSPAFERIWQLPKEEAFRDPAAWRRAVIAEDQPLVERMIEERKRDAPVAYEYRIRRPDGTLRWVRSRAYPTKGVRGERLTCGITQDITERKQAETALQHAHAELENRVAERTAELHAATARLQAELAERDRMSAQLAISEARYRQLTELSPDAIFIHAEGKIVFANTAAARLFAASSPGQLVGREAIAMVHPDSRPLVEERIRRLYAGEKLDVAEVRFLRLDGTQVDAETSAAPFEFAGRRAAQVVLRDITKRLRARAWRNEHSRILQLLTTGAPRDEVLRQIVRFVELQLECGLGSLLLLDADGRRLHGACCGSLPPAYNEAIEGLEIGPAVGSCGTAAFTGRAVFVSDIATDPLWRNCRDLALAHGLRACWSVPILSRQARVLGTLAMYYRDARAPAREEIESIRVAAHIAGIAIEHWQSLETLRERDAEIKLAMEAARMGTWHSDLVTGANYSSDSLGPLFGVPPGAQMGTRENFFAAVHPEDRERLKSALERALEHDTPYQNEFRVLWPDGSVHWLANRGIVQYDGAGRPVRLVGVTMDVSELKQLEEIAAERQTRLEHLSRLQLIDSMAATLAHELNQPIAAVTYTLWGAIERAKTRSTRKAELVEAMRSAHAQTERAAEVLLRVREFARRREPRLERLPVLDLLREVAELAGPDAKRASVVLDLECTPTELAVTADRVQIEQVLINLIRNSIQAMDGTSRDERRISLSASVLNEGRIEIAVCDRGCGIGQHSSEQLFQPFYTTRDDGLGVGLSTCLNIVEAHGGRVWIEPNGHGGATARFTLPAA